MCPDDVTVPQTNFCKLGEGEAEFLDDPAQRVEVACRKFAGLLQRFAKYQLNDFVCSLFKAAGRNQFRNMAPR